MQIKATIDDNGLTKKYQTLPARLDKAVKKAVQRVQLEAKREVTGPQGLSMFPRHAPGTPTPSPASAAFGMNPPAQVSTMLRRTIRVNPVNRLGAARYSGSVMPTQPYARIQEFGGRAGNATLPARPYIRPARERLRRDGKADRIFRNVMYTELFKRG